MQTATFNQEALSDVLQGAPSAIIPLLNGQQKQVELSDSQVQEAVEWQNGLAKRYAGGRNPQLIRFNQGGGGRT